MELLTEKYRPIMVSDLVFVNDAYENKFKQWIETKTIDSHILLYGSPGTGKSSTINVLLNEIGITDFIRINISDKTSIDDMRKVIDFASVPPMSNNYKLVILEEFERASAQAQDSLKYVLEQYSGWCRFIFTTNNIAKVSDAIRSRCQLFHFNTLKFEEFVTRIITILSNENIKFANADIIVKYVETYFPDLRACINAISQNTIDNVLQPLKGGESYSIDKFTEILTKFNNTDILTMKKLLADTIANEDYESLYQFMYNHLDMITSNKEYWDKILVIIANYLYKHTMIAFPDINFISCLIEIKNVINYSPF